ncbi:MAG TPA: zinc/iron-chelating domain-containing protein [Acidobacterium sp.]|nr:zinc/iron-chelating domain-containing protein [Acidobacterium sp.]
MGSDAELLQIVDAATAEAAQKSGDWLACRPGCTQCCVGVFAISQLDAERLRHGLTALAEVDTERAGAVRERVRRSLERIAEDFPGDVETGVLAEEDEGFEERFAEYANDEVCPVLDPETGLCDLYVARPMTCRTFGPPVESADGLAVCELCFVGAPEDEVARCAVSLEHAGAMEETLTREAESRSHQAGPTLVAFALRKT